MAFTGTENQFNVFLPFLILGVIAAVIFFVFASLNNKQKKLKKLTQIVFQILFALTNSFIFYLLALKLNCGIIRWFMVLGVVLGSYLFKLIMFFINKMKTKIIAKKVKE